MKKLNFLALLMVGITFLVASCSKDTSKNSSDVPGATSGNMSMTIPDQTPLRVTLADMVQTNVNHVGDRFTGTVADPVVVDGSTVIPQGTKVDLVITRLVKGGTLKTSPEIAITVQDITLPDGGTYDVKSSEFYEKGSSHTKREVGMIGGGAAAGAVVGGLLGKGKGAVVGAVTGAAAGTGVAAATGRQNLILESGRTVTFTLKQPLNVAMRD